MEKVSILMSTFREPVDWVKCAVESIITQTYANIEFIIVVDDPENIEVVKMLKGYAKKHDNVRIIVNNTNIGLVKSLNKGLKYCTGEYVARMDADDISLPDRIEKEMTYIKRMEYDLVGCRFMLFSDSQILGECNPGMDYDECRITLKYYNCIGHPTWLVKRNVYEILEGYRDIDTCEDYDFLIRAVLKKFKIGNYNGILLKYRYNLNGISQSKRNKQILIARLLKRRFRENSVIAKDDCSLISENDIKKFGDMLERKCQLEKCKKNKIYNMAYKMTFLVNDVQMMKYIIELKYDRAMYRLDKVRLKICNLLK